MGLFGVGVAERSSSVRNLPRTSQTPPPPLSKHRKPPTAKPKQANMLLFAPLPETERTATMSVVAAASEELDSYAVFASSVSSAFEAFCDELADDIQSFSFAALFGSTANNANDATPTTDAATTATTATTIAAFEDDNSIECDSEIAMLEDNGLLGSGVYLVTTSELL